LGLCFFFFSFLIVLGGGGGVFLFLSRSLRRFFGILF